MPPLPASLGILNLERGLPDGAHPVDPRPGHLFHPSTFDFSVISETVKGAWADNVIRGDSSLDRAYLEAARKLVSRGAVAISANCGFTIRHQDAIAAAVDVPVATSSLLMLPLLLGQLPRASKVAVITADSKHLTTELLGLSAADHDRVVIGGVEGGTLWRNEMTRPPPRTEVCDIASDVMDCVTRLRKQQPRIGALLFECTAFPTVSQFVRSQSMLPVYDIADLCRITFASVVSARLVP